MVVSAKSYNKASRLCLCCPITHRQKGYPFEIELPKGLTTQGVILSDQIRSLDWEARRAEFVDDVPLDLVQAVLDRLNPLLNE